MIEGSVTPPGDAAAVPDDGTAAAAEEEHVEMRLWRALGEDAVLLKDVDPPPRFEYARERLLLCRLYLGLIRTLSDDYATFATTNDSASLRAIGIYVFFRTMMCAPVYASSIAQVLKLPRATVLHGLQELIKRGYVERVGNAYRATEKVNIPDLGEKLQARIDMIADTARQLGELQGSLRGEAQDAGEP